MKNRGSIDVLPSGRHRVRVPSGRGQVTWGTFDTQAEAERELAIALHESDLIRRDYEGTTVHQLGNAIMTRREIHREVRDPASDRSRWDKPIKGDEIGGIAVVKLQPKHVHRWLGRLHDKGLSAQTVRHCRNLLSVVLGEACAQGTIKPARSAPVAADAGDDSLTTCAAEREAFEARVCPEPNSGCWLWTGHTSPGERYARAYHNGEQERTHRISWMLYRGPIPKGLFVCHRCDQPLCVNPEHLFLGTHSDNMRDCVAKGRHPAGRVNAAKTHCPRGHAYDYVAPKTGKRGCTECRRRYKCLAACKSVHSALYGGRAP